MHCDAMICTHSNVITRFDVTMDVPSNVITHCDFTMHIPNNTITHCDVIMSGRCDVILIDLYLEITYLIKYPLYFASFS